MFKKLNEKHVIIISLLLVFVAGILIGGSIFIVLQGGLRVKNTSSSQFKVNKNNQKSLLDNLPRQKRHKEFLNDTHKSSSTNNLNNLPTGFQKPSLSLVNQNGELIFKGDVTWQEPKILDNLGLTDDKMYHGCASRYNKNINPQDSCPEKMGGISRGVRYVKVGTIIRGKFKGNDIIVLKTGYVEGPGGDNFVTMLKKDNKITFLLSESEAKYMIDILGRYFNKGDYEYEALSGVKFEELILPNVIRDDKTGATFIKDKYTESFFDKTNLKIAFKHPVYGTVWMTKPIDYKETKSELNSYLDYDYKNKQFVKKYIDIFQKNGFYIKMPNGLTATYKLKLDLFDRQERFGVLQAIWDNGVKNTDQYEENPSGCGSASYVYNETGNFNIQTDLVRIGKTTSGDVLYGYADTSTDDFKKLYNDIYHPRDGKKKTEDEFLLMHPKVFYVDPYNRLLAFYREDILSPAECGKPVIYLYPEKPMDVNVRVEPNQGISVSEPTYPKNGWDVFAKPSGELIFKNKKYPYLFWEGSSDVSYQQSNRGWVVAKDDLNKFFDNKLKQLGLIQKEINDFKEFWIPTMTKNNKPYYFVTFLPRKKIDQLAPLSITPKPDTIIRVMMDYRELDQKEEAVGFKIKTPQRKGFVAVEWGGMLK